MNAIKVFIVQTLELTKNKERRGVVSDRVMFAVNFFSSTAGIKKELLSWVHTVSLRKAKPYLINN